MHLMFSYLKWSLFNVLSCFWANILFFVLFLWNFDIFILFMYNLCFKNRYWTTLSLTTWLRNCWFWCNWRKFKLFIGYKIGWFLWVQLKFILILVSHHIRGRNKFHWLVLHRIKWDRIWIHKVESEIIKLL